MQRSVTDAGNRGRGRVLVYGYGNPGRQDDGIGPAVVGEIDREIKRGTFSLVDTDANYQLGIEDAAQIGGYDLVLFVDTAVDQEAEVTVRKVEPGAEITFTSHFVKPESVLAMCEDLYGSTPSSWIIGVRGYSFEYAEGLTPQAERNFRQALGFIILLLRAHEEGTMAKEQKTVLII
ncbi:MAG: hydrogenase maturation protease, partial [Spirochaetota bacterium]